MKIDEITKHEALAYLGSEATDLEAIALIEVLQVHKAETGAEDTTDIDDVDWGALVAKAVQITHIDAEVQRKEDEIRHEGEEHPCYAYWQGIVTGLLRAREILLYR